MAQCVLIALDDSPQASDAFEHALAEHADTHLIVLTVVDPAEAGYDATAAIPSFSEEWFQSAKARARERLDDARERARDSGVDVETAIEVGPPASVIVEYAEDHDVDLIVMGSHGRSGISRVLVGSVAETVIRGSPVPVTVVR